MSNDHYVKESAPPAVAKTHNVIPQEMIDLYRKHLKTVATPAHPAHTQHVLWMLDQLEAMTELNKANRWLGFVQGYCWVHKIFTIDQMREHVRKLMW